MRKKKKYSGKVKILTLLATSPVIVIAYCFHPAAALFVFIAIVYGMETA